MVLKNSIATSQKTPRLYYKY